MITIKQKNEKKNPGQLKKSGPLHAIAGGSSPSPPCSSSTAAEPPMLSLSFIFLFGPAQHQRCPIFNSRSHHCFPSVERNHQIPPPLAIPQPLIYNLGLPICSKITTIQPQAHDGTTLSTIDPFAPFISDNCDTRHISIFLIFKNHNIASSVLLLIHFYTLNQKILSINCHRHRLLQEHGNPPSLSKLIQYPFL
ncbi:unnamed protein product [Lactuca saligna]|uniref:Uncharacterized protein n=1 Tax=Lactuca saligna TaxID=75948 RepID=A0AA35USV1_LACSI|nr:unnamed protein product [Lactuca saligna]